MKTIADCELWIAEYQDEGRETIELRNPKSAIRN